MNWFRHILIFLVRIYQWLISPLKTALFGPMAQCRFTPSCSHYAIDALRTHGACKGGALAAWRICRCNPWGGCGEDPVPPAKSRIHEPEPRGSTVGEYVQPDASHAAVGGRG